MQAIGVRQASSLHRLVVALFMAAALLAALLLGGIGGYLAKGAGWGISSATTAPAAQERNGDYQGSGLPQERNGKADLPGPPDYQGSGLPQERNGDYQGSGLPFVLEQAPAGLRYGEPALSGGLSQAEGQAASERAETIPHHLVP